MRRVPLPALALALGGLALLAAGCGDDDDQATAPAATEAATATTTATTATAATTTASTTATTASTATTAASTSAAPTTAGTTAASSPATSAGGGGGGSQPECEPVGDISTATTTVDYQLEEFQLVGPTSVSAGQVGFQLTNTGRAAHEMLVIKADSFEGLPKNENGTVLQDQLPAGSVVGAVDRFPGGGGMCNGTFALDPGRYVLVCNIEFQNGPQIVSHAGRGMHVDLEVTA